MKKTQFNFATNQSIGLSSLLVFVVELAHGLGVWRIEIFDLFLVVRTRVWRRQSARCVFCRGRLRLVWLLPSHFWLLAPSGDGWLHKDAMAARQHLRLKVSLEVPVARALLRG